MYLSTSEHANTTLSLQNSWSAKVRGNIAGFCAFVRERRDDALTMHSTLDVPQALTDSWNQLTDSEKAQYGVRTLPLLSFGFFDICQAFRCPF